MPSFFEFISQAIQLDEFIRHTSAGWVVLDHTKTKRLGGPYPSKAKAVKRLKQVDYFKHLDENYWDDFYSDWGYIRPNGKIARMPKGATVSDGHEELAERLGYESIEDALANGLVRFAVARGTGRATIQCKNAMRTRAAAASYVEKLMSSENIDVEIYNSEMTDVVFHKTYTDAKTAALQIRGKYIAESAAGHGVQEWGFITQRKVVKGDRGDHRDLARQMHFSDETDAILHGLVRYVVDANGDINFEMVNKKPQRVATVAFLGAYKEGHVYVDFSNKEGIAGYKDYESPKEARALARLQDDEFANLEEAEVPTTHQGAPIAAWSKEWGFIKPDGKVTRGVGHDGHLGLARKMGFQSETDAIKKGYTRYVIDPEGNASLEFVSTREVKYRTAAWLKLQPSVNGDVYVDTMTPDGNNEHSEVVKGREAGVRYINALKEPKTVVAENKKRGLITPLGEALEATSQQIGYGSPQDALNAGCASFAADPDGTDISLVSTPVTLANIIKFLQSGVVSVGAVIITFLDQKGNDVGTKAFTTPHEAASKLPALREPIAKPLAVDDVEDDGAI